MKEWVKNQEDVYAGKGFGETERSIAVAEARFRVVIPYLGSPPKFVLDLGCNDGSFTEFLQKKGYKAIGVDLPEVVKKAKEARPDCDFLSANIDSETVPLKTFKDNFDVVVALEIIEHLYYDVSLLRSALYYLKATGILIVATPSTDAKIVDDHIRYYPLESLRKLLTHSGFKVVGLKNIGEYNVAIGEKI